MGDIIWFAKIPDIFLWGGAWNSWYFFLGGWTVDAGPEPTYEENNQSTPPPPPHTHTHTWA